MKLRSPRTTTLAVGFVVFIVVFAYFLLTYTRRVDGISMLPTLEEGDLVVIQKPAVGDFHVGDIVVYNPPCSATGFSVIHRIVNVSNGEFVTKGDNNAQTDQVAHIASSDVSYSCIVGKVVFVVPYVERLASLPDGLNYVLAFVIVLAVVFYELQGTRGSGDQGQKADSKPSAGMPTGASFEAGAQGPVQLAGDDSRCQLSGDR